MADLRLHWLRDEALHDRLDDLARLRIAVFREFPYLYDGDPEYEERYLKTFAAGEGAVVVGAFDGSRMVGAATASPLAQHHGAFAEPFEAAGLAVADWFYFAESVLLPEYRGRGIGTAFFEWREEAARGQGFDRACFCAVVREGYDALHGFWSHRGYAPLEGVIARFAWREVGDVSESDHEMQFWWRAL